MTKSSTLTFKPPPVNKSMPQFEFEPTDPWGAVSGGMGSYLMHPGGTSGFSASTLEDQSQSQSVIKRQIDKVNQ